MDKNKKVVTRFAPSPTGMLHIGSARTGLFNYLFAKHWGGTYKLRIEDTDKARNTQESVDAIIDGFRWLGIEHDGDIVFQSRNEERHKEIAYELVKMGKAYYCYTSKEELDELRAKAEAEGKVFKFKSPWRDKSEAEAPEGVTPVIRVKAPLEGGVTVYDVLNGEKTIPADALDDFIILRSDGTPTYMLAVVVDDHDMDITHIIRGNEHYNNAFRQKIIYNAMSWDCPIFCHIPLILGQDKKKLSKRHGAASVMEYKEMGYLPEALRNHLLRLGWSHGDDEIINDAQAIEWFNLESLNKAPAMFDFEKLKSVNKHYLKQKSNEELYALAADFIKDEDATKDDKFKARCLEAMDMIKDRANLTTELADACIVYKDGFRKAIDEKGQKALEKKEEQLLKMLEEMLSELEKIHVWNHEVIKEHLKSFAETEGREWKMKDWTQALRIAITFAAVSPGGIFEIMGIIGRDECLKRVKELLEK